MTEQITDAELSEMRKDTRLAYQPGYKKKAITALEASYAESKKDKARIEELEQGLLNLRAMRGKYYGDWGRFCDNKHTLNLETLNARIHALLGKEGSISKEDFDRHLEQNAERVKAMPKWKRDTITAREKSDG